MITPSSIRATSNWRIVTCGFRRSAARRSVTGSCVNMKASTGRSAGPVGRRLACGDAFHRLLERHRPQPLGLGRVDPQTLGGMDDQPSRRMFDRDLGRLRQRQVDLGRLARGRQQVRLVQVALQLHVQADASQGLSRQIHDQVVLLLALEMK